MLSRDETPDDTMYHVILAILTTACRSQHEFVIINDPLCVAVTAPAAAAAAAATACWRHDVEGLREGFYAKEEIAPRLLHILAVSANKQEVKTI